MPTSCKVLVTSGPTWVAWDAVRVISNVSTGRLGRMLARAFDERGLKVTLLEGPVPHHTVQDLKLPVGVRLVPFQWFEQLNEYLKNFSGRYDVIVHAAAVSDFLPQRAMTKRKISSRRENIVLRLRPAPKLIDHIKKWAPQVYLVAFKLLPEADETALLTAAAGLFDTGCDCVVANRLKPNYQAWIVQRRKEAGRPVTGRRRLALRLAKLLSSLTRTKPTAQT